MRTLLIVSLTAASASLAGCTTGPPIDEGLAPPLTGVISGDAVIAVPLDAPHRVVIFLTQVTVSEQGPVYNPVNVAVIPGDMFFEGEVEGTTALRTGHYLFSQVPAGSYVVSGIVDVDENFNPLVPTTDPATDADLEGAYVDPATGAPKLIPVEPGDTLGEINVIFAVPAE
jgi:hypothetical protein